MRAMATTTADVREPAHIADYEGFVVDQNRRRAGFGLPINFERKPALLGELRGHYKSFVVGLGFGLAGGCVRVAFTRTTDTRTFKLLLQAFYFFTLPVKSRLCIGERVFVRFQRLIDQFHEWFDLGILIGVGRHLSGFDQKLQRTGQPVRKRPLNINIGLLCLQLVREKRQSFQDLARIRSGIACFQARRHLRTQRTVVLSSRSHQPILEISRQAEVGLYVFRGHRRIIQAKCLRATKQFATLATKQSAT